MPESSPAGQAHPRLRTPKLAERVVADFSSQIRNGGLPAGARLPTEYELMRQYRVSRAVVREAISRLQAAGMVDSRQGIGTFVVETPAGQSVRIDPATVLTMRDVLALLELRISFETEAAALAASRRTSEQATRIGACVEAIQQLLDAGAQQTASADFDFHLAIATATQNRYFVDILNFLGVAILPRTRVDLRYMAPDSAAEYLNRSNREHGAILKAIEQADPEGAREAMRIHLSNSRERLQQLAGPGP